MNKNNNDRQVYTEVVKTTDGEVVESKTVYKDATEPAYVKLYLDCVMTIKGLRKGSSPILIEFLKHMSYADANSNNGGQIIYVNMQMKRTIGETLGISVETVNKALFSFVKSNIFYRIGVGTYQVNPNIIGKGEWKDIKKIKNIFAKIDFKNKEIIAEVVESEEETMTKQQEQLEQKFSEQFLLEKNKEVN